MTQDHTIDWEAIAQAGSQNDNWDRLYTIAQNEPELHNTLIKLWKIGLQEIIQMEELEGDLARRIFHFQATLKRLGILPDITPEMM